jgi:hypothetical protein
MTQSNVEPQNIVPDFGTLKHGKLDILVNWNITSETKQDEMGKEYTSWSYESVRINWILPAVYESESAIQIYLDANYSTGENILGWAQASKISAIGT